MQSQTKPIIHLRITVGKPLFDESGKITNENHVVKIPHDTERWSNYLSQLPNMGLGKVEVEKVTQFNGQSYEDKPDLIESVSKELIKSMTPKSAELTPDQKRIAELEAKLEALLSMNSKTLKESENDADLDEELEALRIQYTELTGEIGKKNWKAETIKQKIAEFNEAN